MTSFRVAPADKPMDELVALCKRRGFIYPASEIYGGLNGFWDFGPLGALLKNNLRDRWWADMVKRPPVGPGGREVDIVGVDTAIIQNPRVWEASGHLAGFNDPMVDCRETKARYRHDHLFVYKHASRDDLPMFAFVQGDPEPARRKMRKLARGTEPEEYHVKPLPQVPVYDYGKIVGPDAERPGTLTEPRQFNLMLKTFLGAVAGEDTEAYLRPETAQGIFTNYRNVVDTMRVKVPFGIAQIGKSFRNEVNPRNFIFRTREFEQMEMEFFCHPGDARTWYDFWVQTRLDWWSSLGIDPANLRRRDHGPEELAHYSTACADVEYLYPFTAPEFGELEGIAHRGCYDLTRHQEFSGARLEYFDQERNQRYLPHVIEPAAGLTRGVLVLLCEAYTPDPARPSGVFLRFDPRLAPIQAAVYPLVNKDGMPEVADRLYRELRRHYDVEFDVKQSIGKRYARMDEAGTPFCFTVDGQTLLDQTVTVRHRDTAGQERIGLDQVASFMDDRVGR